MNGTWTWSAEFNLIAAWVGILLGFGSGLMLGLFFRGETWLGGYASFKRRMYRLGHISFFGLGAVNLLFYLTVQHRAWSVYISTASIAFIVGAISMPICCVLLAHVPKLHLLFSVPILSLLIAAGLTLFSLMNQVDRRDLTSFRVFRHHHSSETVTPSIGFP